MAPQIAQDVASRVRFALTQVVLGIDFSRSAVPTHSSPAVVSTEPGPSTRKPSRRRQHEIQTIDLYFGYNSVRCPWRCRFGWPRSNRTTSSLAIPLPISARLEVRLAAG